MYTDYDTHLCICINMYAIDIDTSTCTYHLHVEMDIFLCGGSYNCASEQSKVVRTTTKASEALTRTDLVFCWEV